MSALRVLVGEASLLLPLDAVETVVRTPPITPVPATPSGLVGLFNHQGVVYPAVDPRPEQPSTRRHAVIVRTRAHGRFGVLCDWAEELVGDAGEVLDLDALGRAIVAGYDQVEAALPRPERPSAVVRLKGRSYTGDDAAT